MGIQDMRDRLRASESAHRRTWMPPADSLVYKSYNWWKQETGYSVPRENFCHFWRAATVYAAALYAKQKLAGPVSKSPVKTALTLIGLGLIHMLFASVGGWIVVPMVVGGLLSIAGFIAGCAILAKHDDGDSIRESIKDISGGEYFSLGAVLMYVTFPIMIVGFCVAFAFDRIAGAIGNHADAAFGAFACVAVVTLFVCGAFGVNDMTGWSWWLSILAFVGGLVALAVAAAGVLACCVGIAHGVQTGKRWTSRKLEERRVYAPGSVDGYAVEPEPSAIAKAKQRVKSVLTTIWHVLRLAGEAIWVAKGLAICPYVDLPDSESKKDDLKLETLTMS